MRDQDAYEAALAQAPRNEDGSVNDAKLLDILAGLLEIDESRLRREQAKRTVARNRRPGSKECIGQINLNGEEYGWEPDRLISNGEGRSIEQGSATIEYKIAEAKRARSNAQATTRHADRKEAEVNAFSLWTYKEQRGGRQEQLTFDAFIREAELWTSDDAPPEEDPGADL